MSGDRQQALEIVDRIKAAIPDLQVADYLDYGRTIGVMNPATNKAVYVMLADRSGETNGFVMQLDAVDDAISALKGD